MASKKLFVASRVSCFGNKVNSSPVEEILFSADQIVKILLVDSDIELKSDPTVFASVLVCDAAKKIHFFVVLTEEFVSCAAEDKKPFPFLYAFAGPVRST